MVANRGRPARKAPALPWARRREALALGGRNGNSKLREARQDTPVPPRPRRGCACRTRGRGAPFSRRAIRGLTTRSAMLSVSSASERWYILKTALQTQLYGNPEARLRPQESNAR